MRNAKIVSNFVGGLILEDAKNRGSSLARENAAAGVTGSDSRSAAAAAIQEGWCVF